MREKICPTRSGVMEIKCIQKDCEWWIEEVDNCAIYVIAIQVGDFRDLVFRKGMKIMEEYEAKKKEKRNKIPCPRCEGRGFVNDWSGNFDSMTSKACPECHGNKTIFKGEKK